MRRFLLALSLLAATAVTPAYAEELPCGTRTWVNEAGKTPNGSRAVATDGCHTYNFTTTIGVGPASGEATFKTSSAAQGREAGSFLADAAPNHCAFAAVAQANMAFVNHFKVADGTEVRVKYVCD
jgi:hypothetical protein